MKRIQKASCLVVFLLLASCSLFQPGSITRRALEAGNAVVADDLDKNGDGIISADEIASGGTGALLGGDWEYLAWILSLVAFGEGGRRLGKRQNGKSVEKAA